MATDWSLSGDKRVPPSIQNGMSFGVSAWKLSSPFHLALGEIASDAMLKPPRSGEGLSACQLDKH